MVAAKNIIKKMTVEVDTNSMAMALQLKDNIDTFFYEKIVPIVNHLLDQKIPQNEILNIEKIALEIDYNTSNSLLELSEKIGTEMDKKLTEILSKKEEKHEAKVYKKTLQKNIENAFFYFLKKGTFPWWFDDNHTFTQKDLKGIDNAKLKSILNDNNSLNRLLYQFDIKFITYLFNYINKSDIKITLKFGKIPNLLQKEAFKLRYFKSIFEFAFHTNSEAFLNQLFELFNKEYHTTNSFQEKTFLLSPTHQKELAQVLLFTNEFLSIPIQIIASRKETNSYRFTLSENAKSSLKFNAKIASKINSKNESILIQKSLDYTPYAKENSLPKIEGKKLPDPVDFKVNFHEELHPDSNQDFEEGLIVQHAGLVIIHPFLKHFFNTLGFISENKIIPDKIDEAVHILYYLASKKEQPREHLLPFEKYLCNIPLHYPIKRFISLTPEQKNACEELLEAMLTHWEGLKTKNREVLRTEFLTREGKLKTSDDRDWLYVPRKTQDILLDTLPWSIHLIKVPWKKKILFVEW